MRHKLNERLLATHGVFILPDGGIFRVASAEFTYDATLREVVLRGRYTPPAPEEVRASLTLWLQRELKEPDDVLKVGWESYLVLPKE